MEGNIILSDEARSFLALEDGSFFEGYSATDEDFSSASGEVVFTTGMSGYVQSLTDPSFTGQILVFTYPLIGNYGFPPMEQWEGLRCYPKAVIMSQPIASSTHHQKENSLHDFLRHWKVPYIYGVDTRTLTKKIRSHGALLGSFTKKKEAPKAFYDPNQEHLVEQVSVSQKVHYGRGKKRVLLVDCGMKENILQSLLAYPLEVVRVPFNHPFSKEDADGVLISNGPGDPTKCAAVLPEIRKVMEQNRPLFGICLGSQLMGLSIGAKTYKLKFGHRGVNQPCFDHENGRCYLTSQNHGYAIEKESIPKDWEVYFHNIHDDSVEGIKHKEKPFFSVQFHPESHPGPRDTSYLFEKFYRLCREKK